MSRISVNKIVNLTIARSQTDMKPTPFAGMYPTRIEWRITTDKGFFKYSGKPSRAAIQRLIKLTSRGVFAVSYYEVDKKNVVCRFISNHRDFATQRARTYTGFSVYHPFTSTNKGWEWMLSKWWIKRMKVGDKQEQVVYSSLPELVPALHKVPYRSWYANLRWEG